MLPTRVTRFWFGLLYPGLETQTLLLLNKVSATSFDPLESTQLLMKLLALPLK